MAGVTLDTGALIAASREDRPFWVWWKWLTSKGLVASVPSPVVAQAWRGPRDVRLASVLGGCREVTLDASGSRRTRELCARAATADVVDAFVVRGAADRNEDVLTTDPDDLHVLAAHAPGDRQDSDARPGRPVEVRRSDAMLYAAGFAMLLLPACGATAVEEQPPVRATPDPVVQRPAELPPPAPEPTDLCTNDGWCRPFVAMVIDTVAATAEAVAVGTEAGTVALWADGRWRGGFLERPGVEVRAVERVEGGVRVVTCRERACEGRTWTAEGLSDPSAEQSPPVPPSTTQRSGAWRVEYSTLVRDGDPPIRLSPATALGGKVCARAFGILGDAEHPFALCTHHTRRSLHHVVGKRLVTLVEPWDTTWAPLPAMVFEGAGCAPCLATHQGILVRGADAWTVLPMLRPQLASPRIDDDRSARSPGWYTTPTLKLAVDAGSIYAAGADGATAAWDGAAWTPASYVGPWAREVRGTEAGDSRVFYATQHSLLAVGGAGGFAWRPWRSFLPAQPSKDVLVQVHGVASGDVLNVRAGPSAASTVLGTLAPDARCLSTLAVEAPREAPGWRAVELADGTRGWVSSRYVVPDQDCDRAEP